MVIWLEQVISSIAFPVKKTEYFWLSMYVLSGSNLMHFLISMMFVIISKFFFFDIENFVDNLKSANILAYKNIFLIYR